MKICVRGASAGVRVPGYAPYPVHVLHAEIHGTSYINRRLLPARRPSSFSFQLNAQNITCPGPAGL